MKFYGKVGFWEEDAETAPGIYTPQIVEHTYGGDVKRDTRRFQSNSGEQNDPFTVNNRISILADLYAQRNWASIRYVLWNDEYWKVNSVEVDYPRIILDLGGVWNGDKAGTPSETD